MFDVVIVLLFFAMLFCPCIIAARSMRPEEAEDDEEPRQESGAPFEIRIERN